MTIDGRKGETRILDRLRPYLRHQDGCYSQHDKRCFCGLLQALATIRAREDER